MGYLDLRDDYVSSDYYDDSGDSNYYVSSNDSNDSVSSVSYDYYDDMILLVLMII